MTLRHNHWTCSDCRDGLRDIADVSQVIPTHFDGRCCACGAPSVWLVYLTPMRDLPCFDWNEDGSRRYPYTQNSTLEDK